MATAAKGDAERGEAGQATPAAPKKAELVERLTKALSRLNKDQLTELVRKLDEGELDFAELGRAAPETDGDRLPFGFQERLRRRK